MAKFLPIVNEKDEIIGVKEKRLCTADDITRVTSLMVSNSKGEVLIAKRVSTKYHDPDKWSYAVAGTVESNETYLSNILKEAEEEIDLILSEEDLKEIYHGYLETSHKFFFCMYATICDRTLDQFHLQAEEVAEIRWISKEDLEKWAEERPQDFVKSFQAIQEKIRGRY